MERNAKAALSPHEELVLRRLANGGGSSSPPMMSDQHVHRLLQFELVSKQDGLLVLTAAG